MGCSILWGGVVFEEAGDADVEVREGEDLLLPVFEGVDVGGIDSRSLARAFLMNARPKIFPRSGE